MLVSHQNFHPLKLDHRPQRNTIYRSPNLRSEPKLKTPPLILVTGATGYIGSHVVLEILRRGKWGVVGIDNLSNSSITSIRRVRNLAGPNAPPLFFHQLDLRDPQSLSKLFSRYKSSSGQSTIVHVIHLAALKSVSGSRKDPDGYIDTNVLGTEKLLEAMDRANVRSLVFSSSAVVYGSRDEQKPLCEEACVVTGNSGAGSEAYSRLTSPYGSTKLRCEELVQKAASTGRGGGKLRAVILRYSNPSGNDPSGQIGDSPREAENLMPIVCQVLQGRRDHVCVYGKDYETRDGTGVRDFIHVQDLAKGHLAALETFLDLKKKPDPAVGDCRTYNLSTGQGATVQEIINALSFVSGQSIKTVDAPRRPGDLAVVVCDPSKAFRELGWRAEKTIVDMARDMWTYCLKNPNGLV